MRRYMRSTLALAFLPLAAAVAGRGVDVGLSGSPESMARQHGIAVESGLDFVTTRADVGESVRDGALEPVTGNRDYWVKTTRHRYARPEVRLFIERLAAQYREATGERLVVTSLTRPTSEQPSNAHRLSVHPAGMAVDLRVPRDGASRRWLENSLLSLERAGVLDVTREKWPPHYHVAVFPREYAEYASRRIAAEAAEARSAVREAPQRAAARPAVRRQAAAESGDGRAGVAAVLGLSALGLWRKLRRQGGAAGDGVA